MARQTVGDEWVPLRPRLRAATGERHHALEGRLDLLSPHLSKERYRRLLVGLHGYYSAIEPRLVSLASESRAPLAVVVPGEGEQVKGRWTEVLSWIERLATEPEVDVRKIVSSAVETFRSFESWLITVGALA